MNDAVIKKSFDGKPDTGSNVVNFCSWERLRPYLEQAAGLSANEFVSGLEADETGINIKIKTTNNF